MVLALIVGVILLIICWLLFMPIVVNVNTDRAVYEVYQRGTVRFWLTSEFQPRIQVLGISVPIQSTKKRDTKKSGHKPRKPSSKRQPISWLKVRALSNRILKSITIRWFQLDMDTDDVVLNAKLVPVFAWLSRGPVQLTTNFQGRVFAVLRAEVKVYSIGWALLLFFTKNKNVWK
jgi:hypothetical protein